MNIAKLLSSSNPTAVHHLRAYIKVIYVTSVNAYQSHDRKLLQLYECNLGA